MVVPGVADSAIASANRGDAGRLLQAGAYRIISDHPVSYVPDAQKSQESSEQDACCEKAIRQEGVPHESNPGQGACGAC
jgi:ferredoxin